MIPLQVESETNGIPFSSGIAGRFKLEVVKADAEGEPIPGTEKVVADWFNNLITDQGLDRMGANVDWLFACQVGTGNTTPANSDTQLVTFVAGTSSVISNTTTTQPSSPYYISSIRTYQFGVGAAAGNLSEIGIGWATTGTTLYSRALILDAGGSPTTITILSDEILNATYECRVYPPEVDTTGTVVISAVTYDYTARAATVTNGSDWGVGTGTSAAIRAWAVGMYAHAGALGAITSIPAGASSWASSMPSAAYTPGSLLREGTMVWDISVTPIGSYRCTTTKFGWCHYQVEYDPVIPKTAINELRIVFRHSWIRATIP